MGEEERNAVFDAMQGKSYAERIKEAMTDARLTLRDLERLTRYSYEQLRRVTNDAKPVGSRQFNRAVSKALKLDEKQMWRIALAEKAAAKFGREAAGTVTLPAADEFVRIWEKLDQPDQLKVLDYMKRLYELRRIERDVLDS